MRQRRPKQLPFDDDAFDAALAQLVVHFMTDPVAGLREMARVTRAGGVVAACVWDHAGEGGPLARSGGRRASSTPTCGTSPGSPGAREGHLERLFLEAGSADVEETCSPSSVEHADVRGVVGAVHPRRRAGGVVRGGARRRSRARCASAVASCCRRRRSWQPPAPGRREGLPETTLVSNHHRRVQRTRRGRRPSALTTLAADGARGRDRRATEQRQDDAVQRADPRGGGDHGVRVGDRQAQRRHGRDRRRAPRPGRRAAGARRRQRRPPYGSSTSPGRAPDCSGISARSTRSLRSSTASPTPIRIAISRPCGSSCSWPTVTTSSAGTSGSRSRRSRAMRSPCRGRPARAASCSRGRRASAGRLSGRASGRARSPDDQAADRGRQRARGNRCQARV